VDHYKRFYTPNNAVVVVVGDFESAKALEIVRKTFGAIPRGPTHQQVITREPAQNGERRTEVIRDVETPAVMIAYHMGAKGDPDYLPLWLLDRILSSGRSSRLYHDLVYTRKIAQQVGTMVTDNKDPGLFLAYAVPMPGHAAAELEAELLKALDKVKTEDIGDRELQKAVNQAEAGYLFGQQKDHELGTLLGQNEVLKDWRLVNDYLAKLRAVTKADIKQVAAGTFTRRNRSVVTLVPAKEVKE
jgi:predicted Zn-dependent peptidase